MTFSKILSYSLTDSVYKQWHWHFFLNENLSCSYGQFQWQSQSNIAHSTIMAIKNSDSDVWSTFQMHTGNSNYHNWYKDFALYCTIHQRLSKKFTNFNYALQHACVIKQCVISLFHFTDDKLIHTIWQLSYESCYPSASSTEDNVMLSIPRTWFQYCFCLFFQKQTRAGLSALSVIVARATVFSLREIVILFYYYFKKITLFSSKYFGKYIVCGLKKK